MPTALISTRRPLLDLAFVSLLLMGANFLWGRHDLGWFKLNPSPWILLPLLIGARWGFVWGLAGGLVSAGIAVIAQGARHVSVEEIWHGHAFFLLAFPLVGLAAGEISDLLQRRHLRLTEKLAEAEARADRLSAAAEVLDESRHLLQQRLALLGSEACSLDRQLASLFTPDAPPLATGLLRVMRDTCGVVQAAVYRVDGRTLKRDAVLGDADETSAPAEMPVDRFPIASLAVEKASIVTIRDLFLKDGTPNVELPAETALAALPCFEEQRIRAIVLIHRMQFASLNWRTFARMQLICRWVDQNRRPDAGPRPVTAPEPVPVPHRTIEPVDSPVPVAAFAEIPEA